MLALRLPPEIEKRLDNLAKRTGRTKSHIAREAILSSIEEFEDIALAEERLRKEAETVGWDEVKARLFGSELTKAG